MASKVVQQYLTQDFSDEEKKSYYNYIKGDIDSIDWIPVASTRREPLLLMNIQCDKNMCKGWVGVRETGVCKCSNGHTCYDVVIAAIKRLG
jgi:hypothetical protein